MAHPCRGIVARERQRILWIEQDVNPEVAQGSRNTDLIPQQHGLARYDQLAHVGMLPIAAQQRPIIEQQDVLVLGMLLYEVTQQGARVYADTTAVLSEMAQHDRNSH